MSSAECLVGGSYAVANVHVEFCGVDSWQNGSRCWDGVNVLWCHSHLVW